ncbi:hypothetical protein ABT304_24530 [Nocardioides sp. NPDC000445]|uniref:hypothetical protein n=1 Tax=Nocardioides sp. NPDC000445 TaxID=3154257 RepID=UPI00332BEACB
MEGNVSSQIGPQGATFKLGRFFFHWCVAFGIVILLAFQSLTALIVPSASDYEVSGPVSLLGSVALGIFAIYLGVTTYRLAHGEKTVIAERSAGFRILLLLAFAVLALIRGLWWIVDIAGGNADSVFNYVGMVWFTVAGAVGIPLAFMLFSARKEVE